MEHQQKRNQTQTEAMENEVKIKSRKRHRNTERRAHNIIVAEIRCRFQTKNFTRAHILSYDACYA